MAGLSAVVHLNPSPVSATQLQRSCDAARHRGEHRAEFVHGQTALAYIDHDTHGASKLAHASDNDGNPVVSVVMTGQLYNGAEVRSSLPGVATCTDAQLILAAYQRWGAHCVERFDGDFAFVVHDTANARVVCARDAFGMHPLCYAVTQGQINVASEPRQLIAAGVSNKPCAATIATYLAATRHLYGGPRSYYDAIFKVEAGHVVVIDASGARASRYWQLEPGKQIDERTDADLAARVRELMVEAVNRRLPDQAPYACALSGGFDSSSVAALYRGAISNRESVPPLETFSFELRDLESDEPDLIDAVSADLGSNHHHIYLDQDNVFEVLPAMLAACDEPTFDMGLLYLWRKKEEAARHGVRVMLSGLGGDELFVGQYHFLADLLRGMRIPTLIRELRGIYPRNRTTNKPTSLEMLLRAYVFGPLIPRAPKTFARRVLRGESIVPPWIDKNLASEVGLSERIKTGPDRLYRDAYRQDCYEVFQSSLVDVTLPVHEALGSAFGIETRFPLLDRRLVEYMFAVPREQKILAGEVRGIQRRSMQGLLPEAVLTRHIKKNINPVLRRQQYANFVKATEQLFAQPELRCTQYIDGDQLRAAREALLANSDGNDGALVLWYAMNLEAWLKGLET